MTTFVVGVKDVHSTATLCDYLGGHLESGDVVHAVNSQRGGESTDSDTIRDGEDALNVASARLAGSGATVESHQFVRGNTPTDDLLTCVADEGADELAVTTGTRSPGAEVVFGSVTRKLLARTPVPVRVVPYEEA